MALLWPGRMAGVVRFRNSAAAAVAGLVAAIAAVPLATSRWYLLPLLCLPLGVAVWAWRAGTDASPRGLRVRALLGSRSLPWSEVDRLVVGERRRVYAVTTRGTALRLPAVSARDLPRLMDTAGPSAGAVSA